MSMQVQDVEIFSNSTNETVWVLRDIVQPLVGDRVCIENADGSVNNYRVSDREWLAPRQGSSSFTKLRLYVDPIEEPDASAMIG